MNDKIVHLAFHNKEMQVSNRDLLACGHCKNKAFSVVYQGENEFPKLQCTACEQFIGAFGWYYGDER